MDKTDHFVVIESGVVGKFRDSKDGEDVIQGGRFNAWNSKNEFLYGKS